MRGKIKHGHNRVNARTSTYRIWDAMIQRCTNEKATHWHRYGGRGITVCERWRTSFEAFLADMGERPDGLSIDRKNNDDGYHPGNCRWVTMAVQARNKSCTKLDEIAATQVMWLAAEGGHAQTVVARAFGITAQYVGQLVHENTPYTERRAAEVIEHDGERLTISQWAKRYGIDTETLRHRIRRQPMADALAGIRRFGAKKITPDDVRAIRQRIAVGDVRAQIARDYGVTATLIGRIKTGQAWGRLP